MKLVDFRRVALFAFAVGTGSAPAFATGQATIQPASSKQAASAEHEAWCKHLTRRLPDVSVSQCLESGLAPTGYRSVQGFPILAKQIDQPTAQSSEPRLRVLLIGGIHGDELTSSAVVFHWLRQMQTPAAQEFEWSVAPVVNPDGLLARKPSRVNANGVDLNRNFPTPGWLQEAPRYWTVNTRSDPRRFPGKKPLSEPESQWINQEMARFRPDVVVSVHAPYGVLDFDGFVAPPSRFGRLALNKVGVYPGSLGNYGGLHKNVPVVTIELPHAQTMPPQTQTMRIWEDMLAWMKANVKPNQDEHALQTADDTGGHSATDSPPVKKDVRSGIERTGFPPHAATSALPSQPNRSPSSGE